MNKLISACAVFITVVLSVFMFGAYRGTLDSFPGNAPAMLMVLSPAIVTMSVTWLAHMWITNGKGY